MTDVLTQERLRAILRYDELSGTLYRRNFWNGCKPNLEAGSLQRDGYIQIIIEGRNYRAHRLVWLYVYGVWPSKALDHIDGNRANNRIENLREATQSQNEANKPGRRTNLLGKGVQRMGNRFRAQIQHNGKFLHLGSFLTKEDAAEAYRRKAIEIHGDFVHPLNRGFQP